MAKWICLFNDEWLTEFKAWLEKVLIRRQHIELGHHAFDISNMGRSAVTSHATGKKQE